METKERERDESLISVQLCTAPHMASARVLPSLGLCAVDVGSLRAKHRHADQQRSIWLMTSSKLCMLQRAFEGASLAIFHPAMYAMGEGGRYR